MLYLAVVGPPPAVRQDHPDIAPLQLRSAVIPLFRYLDLSQAHLGVLLRVVGGGGQRLGIDAPLSETGEEVGVLDGDLTCADHRLHLVGQPEDPEPLRHMTTGAAHPPAYLRLRPSGVHQPPVPDRFLHRVQVEALQVLDQHRQESLGGGPSCVHQCRHGLQSRPLSCRHPAVTGHQVPPLAVGLRV